MNGISFWEKDAAKISAIDDYGTGSASSSIVMNIPMDEIKIDMI